MDDINNKDILESLEEMITLGEFTNGDRLDEIKLSEKFGVSRTPIRGALQQLVASGLAEHKPRRGVFIKHPGPVELVEMFEVMAELEAVCARLAAKRISDQALEDLEATNRICRAAIDNNDANAYYRENEVFHHIIYEQSGNRFLAQEASRLHKRLKSYRRMQLHLRGRMQQSMKEHNAVVTALKNGEAELASSVMRGHVAIQGEKFQHLMAQSNFS